VWVLDRAVDGENVELMILRIRIVSDANARALNR